MAARQAEWIGAQRLQCCCWQRVAVGKRRVKVTPVALVVLEQKVRPDAVKRWIILQFRMFGQGDLR